MYNCTPRQVGPRIFSQGGSAIYKKKKSKGSISKICINLKKKLYLVFGRFYLGPLLTTCNQSCDLVGLFFTTPLISSYILKIHTSTSQILLLHMDNSNTFPSQWVESDSVINFITSIHIEQGKQWQPMFFFPLSFLIIFTILCYRMYESTDSFSLDTVLPRTEKRKKLKKKNEDEK